MKRSLISLILLVGSITVGLSQQETLFSRSRIVGGFGGPIVEFGQIKGQSATSVGGGGGIVIDNVFIGAYGVGSIEDFRYQFDDERFEMDLAHGGLWLGYSPYTYRVVHPYASARIGWGFADIKNNPFEFREDGDAIYVITPEVGVELNVTRFFRIAGSVGYRFVGDVDQLDNYRNKDFSSLTGQLTFRIGWFGNKRQATPPVDPQ